MMISRGLFGWSPPHIQPLTPVSEVSEPPESPSPYLDNNAEAAAAAAAAAQAEAEEEIEETDDMEPPPAAVPFSRLFACADRLDWMLMIVGSLAAAAHGTALVVYLHYFAKIVDILRIRPEDQFDRFTDVSSISYFKFFETLNFAIFFSFLEFECFALLTRKKVASYSVTASQSDRLCNTLSNNIQFFFLAINWALG